MSSDETKAPDRRWVSSTWSLSIAESSALLRWALRLSELDAARVVELIVEGRSGRHCDVQVQVFEGAAIVTSDDRSALRLRRAEDRWDVAVRF